MKPEPWWPLRWLGTSRPGYVRALVDLPGLKIPMVVGHDQDAGVYWIYTQTTIPNARCEDLLAVRCVLMELAYPGVSNDETG